ncbi:MAG: hypothetical protein OEL66_01420 [Desulfobulbaceae bacterium]|nr:hypothetical protein [Desulfobulbaceae bacterium]
MRSSFQILMHVVLYSIIVYAIYISNAEYHVFQKAEFLPPLILILLFAFQIKILQQVILGQYDDIGIAKKSAYVFSFVVGVICGIMVLCSNERHSQATVVTDLGTILQWGLTGLMLGFGVLKIW